MQVGKDVATALGYSNTRKALLDHVDEDDKMDGVAICDSIGREQKPYLLIIHHPSSSTSQCEIFNHPEFGNLRCIEIDGEPWFVGKDVATALGYSNTRKALSRHVDVEDKQIIKVDEMATLDVKSNFGMTIINESGLYSLILSSKLESAKRFKHWVTSEVLPCIRKHGGYIVPQNANGDMGNMNFLAADT